MGDILVPYRCVGQVFGEVPAFYQAVDKSGNLGFLTVPVNNCILNYSIRPFRLVWSSDHFESKIQTLVRNKKRIFAGLKDRIEVLDHTGTWKKTILKGQNPKFLVLLGDVLVVINDKSNIFVVAWKEDEVLVEFEACSGGFEVSSVIHPDTFFNKIILGGVDGRIRIININTAKLIHEFPSDSKFNKAITFMEQSPAKDVVAFGFSDGFIHLRNIKNGKTLVSFKQDGAVTALSFRTDGYETLASSNSEGTIAIWDLKEQKLVGQKSRAHDSNILSMHYLLGAPFLISGGEDNKIVVWFTETDQSLPIPRKIIEGHSDAVTAFRFCGPNALISAGLDGIVRKFNIHRTDLISRLGIAREVKPGEVSSDRYADIRLEPINDLKLELMREHIFDNIACAHKDSPLVSTWSSRRRTKGSHIFCHDRFTKDPRYLEASVTSIDISNDGALAFIAYSTGHVDAYSMQSGKYKFSLKDMTLKTMREPNPPAHRGSIISVQTQLNSMEVLTIATDQTIKWWKIEQLKPVLKQHLKLPEEPTLAALDRESQLLATATKSGSIRIIDTRIGKTARIYPNVIAEDATFTTLEFSPDSFYLLVADSQSVIRILDVQAALIVGAVKCSNPVKKAQFSENGRFVVTCHENQREIFVWTNRLFYTSFSSQLKKDVKELQVRSLNDFGRLTYEDDKIFDLESDNEEEEDSNQPTQTQTLVFGSDDEDMDVDIVPIVRIDKKQSLELTKPDLISLSGEPTHRWVSLPYIDKIKQRNTIKEVVQKPIDVPFFLDSTPNESEILAIDGHGDRRRFKTATRSDIDLRTDWANRLAETSTTSTSGLIQVFAQLIEKPTSIIDFEIRALPENLIGSFIDMLLAKIEHKSDADFVQAILNTFLSAHNDKLCGDEKKHDEEEDEAIEEDFLSVNSISSQLNKLKVSQEKQTEDFEKLFDEATTLLKWIKAAVL